MLAEHQCLACVRQGDCYRRRFVPREIVRVGSIYDHFFLIVLPFLFSLVLFWVDNDKLL